MLFRSIVPPTAEEVIIIPFPYSDLSKSKRRPALISAEVGRADFLFCQITSKQFGNLHALPLIQSDSVSGGINRDSLIGGAKLFTGSEALILGVAGHLIHSKLAEVIGQLIEMLSSRLRDDTF